MRPILFYLPLDWIGLTPVPIFGFGVMLVVAFIAAFYLAWRRAPRYGVDPDQALDLGLYAIVAGLVGARLAFLFWDYEANPASTTPFLDLLAVWRGGLTFQGGLIMALAVIAWYLSSKKIPIGRAMDVFAPSVALGAGIGRLGCFLNSCCWGRLAAPGHGVTFAAHSDAALWQQKMSYNTKEWAARLADAGYPPDFAVADLPLPVVPTQLYEFASLILLAVGLLVLDHLWTRRPAGLLMLLCVGAYSCFRFFIEFERDDTPLILAFGSFEGLKLGQWLSLATFSVCVPLTAVVFLQSETLDLSVPPGGFTPPPPKKKSAGSQDAPAAPPPKPVAPPPAAPADPPRTTIPPADDPWARPTLRPPTSDDETTDTDK